LCKSSGKYARLGFPPFCSIGLFIVEMLLKRAGSGVYLRSLAVIGGGMFLVKAGMLSGEFYVYVPSAAAFCFLFSRRCRWRCIPTTAR